MFEKLPGGWGQDRTWKLKDIYRAEVETLTNAVSLREG